MAAKGLQRGRKVWRSKGAGLLAQLKLTEPSSIPRLIGEPLSTDEYLLAQMAQRQDAMDWADAANCETFGEEAGWDVADMLSAPTSICRPGLGELLVGTCGFMGTAAPKYADRLGAVELNATFHDRGGTTYDSQATKYSQLGLKIVVKVSGYATHDVGLRDPASWWPWLRLKYAPFVNAGVLVGLLWQLPATFTCTEETCERLEALGSLLRSESQTGSWLQLRHAFEFRDSSWFDSHRAGELMRRHRFTLVCSHIANDTGWAGDLVSGWHGFPTEADVESTDFIYIRCFGTSGRSVGAYGSDELQRIASMASTARSAIIMFGQGDAPRQALENAWQMKELLQGDAVSSNPVLPAAHAISGELVSGVVLRVQHGRDRRVFVDVGGRLGFLGSRHTRRRGLDLRKGAVLKNLRVECEERGDRKSVV